MAKRCHQKGGFTSNNDDPVMIGQIQVVDCENPTSVAKTIIEKKQDLIDSCNEVDPILVKFGGGCKDIEARIIETESGPMVIVHILVDCRCNGCKCYCYGRNHRPQDRRDDRRTVILRIISTWPSTDWPELVQYSLRKKCQTRAILLKVLRLLMEFCKHITC